VAVYRYLPQLVALGSTTLLNLMFCGKEWKGELVTEENFLRRIKGVRRDLGHLLFHFTRSVSPDSTGLEPEVPMSAFDVLQKILRERRLIGSGRWVKGGHRCACFTEAPISELASVFALSESSTEKNPRYEPYGIAVRKEWLFERGGRPVIYQTDSERESLPQGIQWGHVRYEPPNIDFTWEREWRLCIDILTLEPQDTLVVVRTVQEAYRISYEFSQLSHDGCFSRSIRPLATVVMTR
jgi:hypothetical protein